MSTRVEFVDQLHLGFLTWIAIRVQEQYANSPLTSAEKTGFAQAYAAAQLQAMIDEVKRVAAIAEYDTSGTIEPFPNVVVHYRVAVVRSWLVMRHREVSNVDITYQKTIRQAPD